MPPRTNDSAPESEHGHRPPAPPKRKRGTGPATGPRDTNTESPSAGPANAQANQPPTGPAGQHHKTLTAGAEGGNDKTPGTGAEGAHHETPTARAEGAHDKTPGTGPEDKRDNQTAAPAERERATGPATEPQGAHTERPGPAPLTDHDHQPPAGPAGQHHKTPTAGAEGARDNQTAGEQDTSSVAGAAGGNGGTPGLAELDPRVAAVRRVGAAGRRWRVAQLAGCAALLAVAITGASIAVGAMRDGGGTAAVAAAPSALSPALLSSGDLDASITALQAHLRSQPKDFGSWATLGLAYVEQARTKGDPSRYPQAEKALKQSLALKPDNEQALTGRAALAAARHDFKDALAYADQVLEQNPYSERALCSRIDALVELGRYDEASKAADTADTRRPGVPVFTRYAYVHELRGDVSTARSVLERALATAATPGDIAYVATALGQLAWNQGDYKTAQNHYGRALAADENYLPALEGRARAQAASGDRAGAIKGMEDIVARYPLPGPLVELGELYEDRGAEGDREKAGDQYALVDAWTALARANGVNADLDTALAAADHGDKKAALRAARAEWARRHTVHTADALAWALHINGRDTEALPHARRATATGYRNAAFLYHRGMIERATGHDKEARTSLRAALKLNPGFSPLGAREARKALEAAK